MMISSPPIVPLWPLYPEPERSRLEAAYRADHEAYCVEFERQLKHDLMAFAFGLLVSAAIIIYALTFN